MPLEHAGGDKVGGRDRGLQRIADRVPQVARAQRGQPEPGGGGVHEDHRPGLLGRGPERLEGLVAEVAPARVRRDLRAAHPWQCHRLAQAAGRGPRVVQRNRAEHADLGGTRGSQRGQRRVLHGAHLERLAGVAVRRHEQDPRGQHQVVHALRGGLLQHDADVAKLAGERADNPPAQLGGQPAVRVAAQPWTPPPGHRAVVITSGTTWQWQSTITDCSPAPLVRAPARRVAPGHRGSRRAPRLAECPPWQTPHRPDTARPISGCSSTSRPVPDSLTWPFSRTTPCVDRRRPARAFCSTSRSSCPSRSSA